MMPTSIVNAKPAQHFAAEQVQREHGENVVPRVMIVRPSVWFTLLLTI